jgi:hypothetical protein
LALTVRPEPQSLVFSSSTRTFGAAALVDGEAVGVGVGAVGVGVGVEVGVTVGAGVDDVGVGVGVAVGCTGTPPTVTAQVDPATAHDAGEREPGTSLLPTSPIFVDPPGANDLAQLGPLTLKPPGALA